MKLLKYSLVALLIAVLQAGCSQEQPEPEQKKSILDALPVEPDGEVFIISPKDGAEVKNPVHVRFGIKGMTVAPAGTSEPLTGHHHLLIDVEQLPDMNKPIPSDENHRHFGKAQVEAKIMLSPGEHTLQLLLGDGSHVPHKPPVVSEKITITVVD